MHLAGLVVYVAIAVKLVALLIFVQQRRSMPNWIFWNLTGMFVVMQLRMLLLAVDAYEVAKYSCLFIAIEVLVAVIYLRHTVRATRKKWDDMRQENKSLAHQLAEHMA